MLTCLLTIVAKEKRKKKKRWGNREKNKTDNNEKGVNERGQLWEVRPDSAAWTAGGPEASEDTSEAGARSAGW